MWRAHKRGALFANPCFTQIHPTCIPVSGDHQSKLTLMSESLRNDGRVWVPEEAGRQRPPEQIPEAERDYYLERKYPSFGNLVPRDVASRNAKQACDDGRGVGESGLAVYLDFADAIQRLGPETIKAKYGNLFHMYQKITDENPYKVPMRIYPAIHYTMGGLWVDYNLMSTIPGLHVLGRGQLLGPWREPPGRQRADAGAGRRLLRHPLHDRSLPGQHHAAEGHDRPRRVQGSPPTPCSSDITRLLSVKGNRSIREIHRELGRILWDDVGMARTEASLKRALTAIPEAARRVLAATSRSRARPTTSIRASNTPAASPTTSSSRNCSRSTRSNAVSRAADISAKRARRRTARRCATMSNFSYVAAWEFTGVGQAARAPQGSR